MNPFSIPVCSIRSDCGCESRFRLQLLHGIVERQPLGDARRQLAVFFQFLVDLEILPVRRIILRRGHAMLRQFRECNFNSLPPLFVRGLRNHHPHRSLRGFAQNPGRLPVGVAINLPALRIAAGHGDARQLQRPRVGHGHVPVHAIQKHRMPARNFIQVPAAGHSFHRPHRLIPASAQNPLARLGLLHFSPIRAGGILRAISRRSDPRSASAARHRPDAGEHR